MRALVIAGILCTAGCSYPQQKPATTHISKTKPIIIEQHYESDDANILYKSRIEISHHGARK